MITMEQLNDNQKRAVTFGQGACLVLAGPGSGKTAVLTLRVANLIKQTPDDYFKVLGLTFTVKAANEMQDRIIDYLGEDSKRIQIRTFHSFCTDLLRQHGSHLGLRPDFTVISDEKDRAVVLKDIIQKHGPEGDLIEPVEDVLKNIDTMFTNVIGIDEISKSFDDKEEGIRFSLLAKTYLDELVKSNQLDFGSMLYLSKILMTQHKRITRQVQTVYEYICVDEFQDTNPAQYEILKLIAPPKQTNLFVVADDDQIIFQWNGADPKRLAALKSDYDPEVIQLPDNFRCPKPIVELANRLIQHNNTRLKGKKPGRSQCLNAGVVNIQQYDDFESEIDGVVSEISSIPYLQRETCLIIARSNKLLEAIKKGLDRNNIEAEVIAKKQEFSSPLILFLHDCLRLANAPASRSFLNKLCAAASKIDGITFSSEEIIQKSLTSGAQFLRAFFEVAKASESLQYISECGIELLCSKLEFKNFMRAFFQHYSDSEIVNNCPDYEKDKEVWDNLYSRFERENGSALTLHVFLQCLELTPKNQALTKSCVRLQTVHTAKGMEYAHVYLLGMVEQYFPSYQATKQGGSSRVMEEERRNCFVAVTRASQTLYISYASNYFGYNKNPSRFLYEMGVIQ